MPASSPPDGGCGIPVGDIVAGAAALGVLVTPEDGQRLARFAGLLMRWNAVHNLTAVRTPDEALTHHLLDSLVIVPRIDAICRQSRLTLLDVGAGGGLPGIPLAVVRPGWHVTLVDKVQKKVAFLTQARLELGLVNVECRHARVEQLKAGPFDVIVSRAFASLVEFVRVSRHLLAPGGRWAAMKGARPTTELAELARTFPDVRVADVVTLDVPRLRAERHLVLLQCP